MAIYRSTAAQTDVRPANHPEGVLHREHFTLALTATTLLTGDLLYLAHINKDSTVSAFMIDFPLLDSTATVAVGDTTTAGLYVSAGSLACQAAGRFVSTAAVAVVGAIQGAKLGTLPVVYTVSDYLVLSIGGVVASGVNPGTIRGWLDYKMTPYFLKRRGS